MFDYIFIHRLVRFFPALLILLITSLCKIGFLSEFINLNAIFIISLLFIFPLLFLLQGILCVITKTNVFFSLCFSCLSALFIIFIYLDVRYLSYLISYVMILLLGYIATKIFIILKKALL